MLDKELIHIMGFPDGSNGRESACNARDLGLILGSGRSPGEGTGYPLQYSCQENSMDRKAIVNGVVYLDLIEQQIYPCTTDRSSEFFFPFKGRSIPKFLKGAVIFPGGSDGKESACNAGDLGWIPGSGRSPGEGTGYPLQYSCLENSMNRGAWQATVHGVTQSQMQLRATNTSAFCLSFNY